ncbi:MAG: hypothetical protein AB1631_20035 [Acidobacteriota bacterium]
MNHTLQKEILDQLDKLPPDQQHKVLDFARSLAKAVPVGKQGKELLKFAGTIEAEDLKIISQAIEEDCEQVNVNEW